MWFSPLLILFLGLAPVSRKSPYPFGPEKLFYVCRVWIQDQSFINFENDTMKPSFSEAKLTDLWARNCATFEQFSDLKISAFGPEKLSGLSRNGPLTWHAVLKRRMIEKKPTQFQNLVPKSYHILNQSGYSLHAISNLEGWKHIRFWDVRVFGSSRKGIQGNIRDRRGILWVAQ